MCVFLHQQKQLSVASANLANNNNQSIIPSTDVKQLTLTLKMTTAQIVETPVSIQDYVHPDDQTQPTFEMTPGFKPFTVY